MSPRISTYALTTDSSLSCISHIASFRQNNLIAWKGRPRCLHLKTKRALNSLLLLLLYDEQFRSGGQRAPPRGIMHQPSNYVNNQKRTVSFNTSGFQPCDRCGQTGHNSGTCRFENSFWFFCAKQGHIKRACRLALLRNPPRWNELLARRDLNRQLDNNQAGAAIH